MRGGLFADKLLFAIPADKRLRGQSKPQLEAKGEGCYLRHTADLRSVVLELFEGLFLRFGQRLRQLFSFRVISCRICAYSPVLRKLHSDGVILP